MNDKHIININGKPFILYAGLLEESHKRGIQILELDIAQFPRAENDFTCICKATLESKNDEIFSEIGDCNPKNVGSKIIPHLIRMASTRAKSRVIRDYCNIGMCSFEELNPYEMEAEAATLNKITLIKKLTYKLITISLIEAQLLHLLMS